MMFQQWLQGQPQSIESTTGADFNLSIKAVQTAAKAFIEFRKTPQDRRTEFLGNFKTAFLSAETELTEKLVNRLGYPLREAQFEFAQATHLIAQLEERLKSSTAQIPLGPCLIYGSWSSPLLRVCQSVLSALAQGNSVLLLTNSVASSIYCDLGRLIVHAGFAPELFTVIASQDPEAQEVLLTHPSLRAVHWASHAYEGLRVRQTTFDANKKTKFFFGGHNPVIFLHDAPLVNLPQLLDQALRYHYRGEERFHRWFVQDKNFDVLVNEVKNILTTFSTGHFGRIPEALYKDQYVAQMRALSKEKGWVTSPGQPLAADNNLALQIATDFNNCSPWHQSENIGPLLTITRFKNSQEAIKFTNTTLFANAACVISSTHDRSAEVATQLQMPKVYLNSLPLNYTDEASHAGYESGQGNDVSDFQFFTYPKMMC